ncbi:hypothetical protein PVAR5_8770 [Paecilomyces variotii No. 5]|uniref:Uncharacterized protein n=1 Tax=Byssochlamys spectabilis (strain No. 5 / NBRC 109023) TaxID=1356009 RepID=V5GGH0_BYSSN|nr:hypothetical protein PVAR5_8770 [Paecilomyces variotii No. 5]
MGQSKAQEKERAMPFSLGLPIFDESTGKYVTRKPAAKPVKKSVHNPARLRDMTPFHKGYDSIHKNKRAKKASSADSKGRKSSLDLESEPEYNRSRFLGHGDGKNPSVYNPYNGRYERLSFNELGVCESQSGNAPSARPGNYGIVHGTIEQKGFVGQKNGGLAVDNPVVLFPGDPLAVAARKARELEEEFPGMPLDKALVQKKRKIASEKEATNHPAKKRAKSSTNTPDNQLKLRVDLAAWFEHGKGASHSSRLPTAGNTRRPKRRASQHSAMPVPRNTSTGLLSPPETQ